MICTVAGMKISLKHTAERSLVPIYERCIHLTRLTSPMHHQSITLGLQAAFKDLPLTSFTSGPPNMTLLY